MIHTAHPVTPFGPCTIPPETDVEYARVRAEFREMPGLTLTLMQAARLFGLDPGRCERVLQALVRDGLLVTDGRSYARAGDGWH